MFGAANRFGARARLMIGTSLVLPVLVMAVTPAVAQQVAANDQVETVVVTAQKRPENVQNVPMSVSAFSGDQLEQRNITSMDDLARFVPSLSINTANVNRNTSIIIRNIGSSGTNPGIEPSVGVFLDGVYQPASGAIFNELLDVQTVEVLRGPQGTLYGRNTPVGALNITTRAPTQTPEGMAEVQYGNYDRIRVSGYVGGGITDDLAGRLSAWTDSNSGYVKNIYDGDYTNDSSQYGGRARLRWTPDAVTTVDLIASYTKIVSHGGVAAQRDPYGPGGIATPGFLAAAAAASPLHPFVALGPWEVNEDNPGRDKTDIWGVSLSASRDLDIGATLTDIIAYNSFVDDAIGDTGALPQSVFINGQRDDLRTISNELRLVSDGKHFIDYVAGIYLFHQDLDFETHQYALEDANRLFPFGGINPYDTHDQHFAQRTNSAAAYGQATVNITDALRVTGGLRYSYDHKDGHTIGVDSNPVTGTVSVAFANYLVPGGVVPTTTRNDHSLTWTGGVQYDITDNIMAYFTSGSGFKDGGFNARGVPAPDVFGFGPERSLTYEAGIKSTLFDRRVLLNADVYRMLLHDFQESTLNPVTGSGFIVGNAGNVRVQGVEIDAQAHPFDPLSLSASLSYADSTFSSYPEGNCISTYPVAGSPPPAGAPQPNPSVPGVCDYTGFTPSYSPKWRWSVSGRWEQPWADSGFNWYVSADVTGVSSQYEDATLDPRSYQAGYALFDASIGIEPDSGHWQVNVWGKNLTNKLYYQVSASQPVGAFVSAGGFAAANGFVGWYGLPRTFGVEGSYRF